MKKQWEQNKIDIILLGISLFIYAVNKLWLKQVISHWFIQCYLNDVMAGICFSAVCQLFMCFWIKRQIRDEENILLLYLAGIYWELIAPRYLAGATADLFDLPAYLLGGMIIIVSRKLQRKRKKENGKWDQTDIYPVDDIEQHARDK